MSASKRKGDRSRLDGFEIEIFKLVQREATSEQWKQWLRAPLEHAAAAGNLDLFTRLMDAGADGKAGWRGCHGRTLLGAAACGNNSDKMVQALLEAGAKRDVNAVFGIAEKSALHVAAARGAEASCTSLMIAGAKPDLRDWIGVSPLHLAAEAGHHGVVGSLLLKGADVNARSDLQETPLHLAASKGHTLCMSELLLGGADKDVVDYEGETPLFRVAGNNHLEAVEKLLAAGANSGIRTNYDYSPLDNAANRGHATIVKAFLDEDTGADANSKTNSSDGCYTPLHVAANHRLESIGTIRALLEGGANVNWRKRNEGTPLHTACRRSSVAGVEILLRWGADEKLTDDGGNTPTDVIGAEEGRVCRLLAPPLTWSSCTVLFFSIRPG
ncbi:unnamed protein product, partial [Ectocarpus fasciculatus]